MIRVAAAAKATPKLVDDSLDRAAAVELDRRAVRRAADHYLAHADRLYDDPVPVDGWDGWLVHPLTTRNDRYWPAFRGYVVLTKLRFRLRDGATGPVLVERAVPEPLAAAVADVCEEFDVACERRSTEPSRADSGGGSADSPDEGLLWGVPGRLYALGRIWCSFLLFVLLAPMVRWLSDDPAAVDARFWLHPLHPDRGRFHDAPTALAADRTVGYAVHDRVPTGGPVATLRSAVRAVRADGSDSPLRTVWHATDPVRAAVTALRLRWRFRRREHRLSRSATTPEFRYLAARTGSVTLTGLLVPLLAVRAFDGVGTAADDGVWIRSQHVTASLPRLTALVGSRQSRPVAAVASHYCSRTRPSNRFTHRELAGEQAAAFPDRLVVADDLSARNLRDDGVAAEAVPVIADKAVAEFGPAYTGSGPPPSVDTTPPDDRLTVLVPLQSPDENEQLVAAARAAADAVDGVELVFKPHPFFDADHLFDADAAERVTSPDADLGALADEADVCLSVYSTATFPALVRGVPVVWLPFVGENHAFMDLVDRVGERADDEAALTAALERLATDPEHYRRRARDDHQFATANLLPGTDRRLADVVRELLDEPDGTAADTAAPAADRHD